MAAEYGVIYIFLGNAGTSDHFVGAPISPIGRTALIQIEHKLRDLPRNMNFRDVDVFFQIRP
jgi:hypothetical protein